MIESKTGPNGKVHQVAAMFPMMSNDELTELADDIKSNGLVHPVVLDSEGTLIDGRNRQEACKRAGIPCSYVSLNGSNPIQFIMSSNDKRRHMTTSQRAMIAAKIRDVQNKIALAAYMASHPTVTEEDAKAALYAVSSVNKSKRKEGGSSGTTLSTRDLSNQTGTDRSLITKASFVLENAPDLVDGVIAGNPLNEAYTQAQKRKQAAQGEEAQLDRLRINAPDLSAQVLEEKLTLAEAIGALNAREEEQKEQEKADLEARKVATNNLGLVIRILEPSEVNNSEEMATDIIEQIEPETLKFIAGDVTKERLIECSDVLKKLAKIWKN